MILGRIDEVDGHFVATRFVGVFVPSESFYFGHRSARSTNSEVSSEGLRIQKDWRSISLGYCRFWLPAIAFGLVLFRAWQGGLDLATGVTSAVLLGTTFLAFRAGRLDEREKARLRLLGTVTGLRVDPSKLRLDTRGVKRDSLGDLMEKGGIPTTPDGILSVLDDIPMPAMPLVYGFARYAGDEPIWQECAELVFHRHEQGEI